MVMPRLSQLVALTSELSLLVDLFFHALALLSERLNLLLSLEEFPLIRILLSCSNAHLMLNITEIKALLFMELFDLNQLLGLQVQLALQFIQIAIKHRNRLLEVINLLILSEELALVSLNIIE